MRGFVLGLSLSVAFIAGSLFGSLAESTADAQQGRQRWEYKCEDFTWGGRGRSDTIETIGRLGGQGWEMVGAVDGTGSDTCFKRRR